MKDMDSVLAVFALRRSENPTRDNSVCAWLIKLWIFSVDTPK